MKIKGYGEKLISSGTAILNKDTASVLYKYLLQFKWLNFNFICSDISCDDPFSQLENLSKGEKSRSNTSNFNSVVIKIMQKCDSFLNWKYHNENEIYLSRSDLISLIKLIEENINFVPLNEKEHNLYTYLLMALTIDNNEEYQQKGVDW